jgi:hypothetical protein
MINTQVEDYVEFINQYSWDWYATLTYRNSISPRHAWHIFNDWKLELKKDLNHGISYFWVRDLLDWDYHPHLHIFLSGTKGSDSNVWEQRWQQIAGWANIELYNPERGASYYLATKWLNDKADIKFSRILAARYEPTHHKETAEVR